MFALKPSWNTLNIPMIILSAIALFLISIYLLGIRYNITESMPVGFYRVIDGEAKVGSIITFCPPVAHKFEFMPVGSCSHGEAPYIKEVVAAAGDVVVVESSGITINGKHLKDSAIINRIDLPNAIGVWTLKDGQFWTYGAGLPKHSFDSRYFGIVKEDIKVVKPYL